MIKNLIINWKTTSIGLTSIFGSVVHLIYQLQEGVANENSWTIAFGGVVVGLGFLFAGDSSKSATKAEVHEIKKQMSEVPSAINTGDTQYLSQAIDQTKPNPPPTV